MKHSTTICLIALLAAIGMSSLQGCVMNEVMAKITQPKDTASTQVERAVYKLPSDKPYRDDRKPAGTAEPEEPQPQGITLANYSVVRRHCNVIKSKMACFSLGYFHEKGQEVPADMKLAAEFYQKACDIREGVSCFKMYRYYTEGKIVEKNDARAFESLTRSCEGLYGKACNILGVQYATGDRVEMDLEKAHYLFGRACDLGIPLGCNNLGVMYAEGLGCDKNTVKSLRLYSRACDRKLGIACNNLAGFYDRGIRVDQSNKKARLYYEKGCEYKDGTSCYNLGLAYLNGYDGLTVDKRLARNFFARSCELNFEPGCITFKELWKQEGHEVE